jgi:hypothetical protein
MYAPSHLELKKKNFQTHIKYEHINFILFLLIFFNNHKIFFKTKKMIQVENIIFVKIKTRYINRKFYLDNFFSQNDCIFKFNNNVKEFSKTWIFFLYYFKSIGLRGYTN